MFDMLLISSSFHIPWCFPLYIWQYFHLTRVYQLLVVAALVSAAYVKIGLPSPQMLCLIAEGSRSSLEQHPANGQPHLSSIESLLGCFIERTAGDFLNAVKPKRNRPYFFINSNFTLDWHHFHFRLDLCLQLISSNLRQ